MDGLGDIKMQIDFKNEFGDSTYWVGSVGRCTAEIGIFEVDSTHYLKIYKFIGVSSGRVGYQAYILNGRRCFAKTRVCKTLDKAVKSAKARIAKDKESKECENELYRTIYANGAHTKLGGENRDCVVKTLCVVTGESYDDVHAALELCGRTARHGTFWNTTKAAIDLLGYDIVPVDVNLIKECVADMYGKEYKQLTTKHPAMYPKVFRFLPENIYCHVSGHALAIKNGKVLDWTSGKSNRINRLYEVVKRVDDKG